MAEERNLGLVRAPETSDDTDATKAELQRRMEEARESISQTVTEIKDTVVNQYQQVRETISDTLDWREQYKRHTLPVTLGAVGVGFLVGYGVMGAFKPGRGDDDYAYDEDDNERTEQPRSYAAAPILGQAHASTANQHTSNEAAEAYSAGRQNDAANSRPSYSSGYRAAPPASALQADATKDEEESGPGLFSRFKETKAYDKLTDELSTLGERAVEELSRTAQAVVVPLLLNKLKNLIGIDLSPQHSATGQQTARTQTATSSSAGGHASGQGGASAYTAAGGTGQS